MQRSMKQPRWARPGTGLWGPLAPLLIALIALFLLAPGCEEKSLRKAAVYGQAATAELAQVQGLVIELNRTGTLDDRNTATIMRTILRANSALQTGKNTVARIQARVDAGSTVTAQDRAALQNLFSDFAQAITELNNAGVTGIKNPDAVTRWDVLIGTVLQTSNLLLALW